MKIAYLGIIDVTAESAETRHVFEMCEAWNRLGHVVTLFVPNAEGGPSQGLGTRVVKMQTFGLRRGFLLTLVYNVVSIFYLLKEFSSKRLNIVYTRQTMLEFIPLLFLKRLGVRYIAEVNGLDSEQKRLYGMAAWKIRLSESLYGICYALADSIVAVTDEIRQYLAHRHPGTQGKTHVVSNGANVEVSKPVNKLEACRELGFDPEKTYFVFVGSLKKWHGVENAILSIERLIDDDGGTTLLIVGDGPEKAYLQRVVNRKGLNRNVAFVGQVQYRRVPLYIGAATACLALFERERNDRTGLSPLKIFEYMACGKPVVATDVGNLRRIIGRHECGLIVKPGDIDAMSEALRELARKPELARKLGENGRQAAVRHYSWSKISEQVSAILQDVDRS